MFFYFISYLCSNEVEQLTQGWNQALFQFAAPEVLSDQFCEHGHCLRKKTKHEFDICS